MDIFITSGKGQGLTELSAFDNALFDAGIANYNLIRLSSVVPTGCKIFESKVEKNDIEIGYRLYVVLASMCTSEIGKEIWAGVGWVQKADGSGVFIEHEGYSEQEVANLIKKSLESMKSYRKSEEFGEIKYKIESAKCIDKPVSVIVAAVFKSKGWD